MLRALLWRRRFEKELDEEIRAARRALDPDDGTAPVPVGPFAPSEQNCTQLCHVGVEQVEVRTRAGYPFPHGPHVGGQDCSACHEAEPHGVTIATDAALQDVPHAQRLPDPTYIEVLAAEVECRRACGDAKSRHLREPRGQLFTQTLAEP